MRNKKVKRMMVDIERHYLGDISPAWVAWIDGVCLVAGANFIWLNSNHAVHIRSNREATNEKSN